MTKCEWCGYGYGRYGFNAGKPEIFTCDICGETTKVEYVPTFCKSCASVGEYCELRADEDGEYCDRCGKYQVESD